MKIYSNFKINFVSIIISIIIYLFIIYYIPKLYRTIKEYFYFKTQPNITQEYEEESSNFVTY